MRGEMLWFNEVKDLGFILTEDGERLSVLGPAFANERPRGRCAHAPVTFEISDTAGDRQAANVVLVTDPSPRRARMRTRGVRR
jgi:cold shock CspA family protein